MNRGRKEVTAEDEMEQVSWKSVLELNDTTEEMTG